MCQIIVQFFLKKVYFLHRFIHKTVSDSVMIRVYTSEVDLQKTVIKYLDLVLPSQSLVHHSPNEGNHKIQYFHKQKLMGVMKGFPDLMILLPNTKPMFVELKQPGNYPTEQQRDVGSLLVALGCEYAVCRSVQDVRAFLEGVKPGIALKENGYARAMIQAEQTYEREVDAKKNEIRQRKRAKTRRAAVGLS